MPSSIPSAKARLEGLIGHLSGQHVNFPADDVEESSIDLRGHSIIVTGGCSGLGDASVRALAKKGAWVAIWDLNNTTGQELEQRLKKDNLQVKFVQVDVTNWESQVKGLETSITASPHGRIDHFIANAGVGGHALTDHIETKRRKNLSLGEPRFGAIQVSLIGSYYLTCLACHHWTSTSTLKALTPFPSGRRSLVIVGSMSSYISMPVGTDYAAAKFGVRGLWSAARETMHTHKLDARINMVSPQFIATNLNKHMQKYYERSGHKFGSVDFAARAVVRMVGDSSVKGRSVTTTIESARDMDDDLSGKYGWTQIEKLIREDLVALYEY